MTRRRARGRRRRRTGGGRSGRLSPARRRERSVSSESLRALGVGKKSSAPRAALRATGSQPAARACPSRSIRVAVGPGTRARARRP